MKSVAWGPRRRDGHPSDSTVEPAAERLSAPSVPSRLSVGANTGWRRLRWGDVAALVTTLGLISVLTWPQLARGICFSDGGDLQLACTVLGVMHPPGYCGFVTVGWWITWIPWVDPAFSVTLGCHLTALAGLGLCMLVQMRLGGSVWCAAITVMAITSHWRVWVNLIEPEVYAPTLVVLAGCGYLLSRYGELGKRPDLLWASLLFGFALANRPTVIWTFPFLLVAWLVARRRWERRWSQTARTLLLAVPVAAVPGVYHLAYLWWRDQPTTAYNYIDNRNVEIGELPAVTAGPAARWQRIIQHTTAQEFRRYMVYSWWNTWKRMVWVYKTFFLYRPVLFSFTVFLLILGMVLSFRRSPPAAFVLLGLAVGNLAFLATYNIYGMAGDMMPLLFSAAAWAGLAFSALVPVWAPARRQWMAAGVALAVAVATAWDAPHRRRGTANDASNYLKAADLATFPPNAVIATEWRESVPLRYAALMAGRKDIVVLVAPSERWIELLAAHPGCPAFVGRDAAAVRDHELTPFRNLWRVGRLKPPPPPAAETPTIH